MLKFRPKLQTFILERGVPMINGSLNFNEGEIKYVKAKVVPQCRCETVVILSAVYELIATSGEVVERGTCETNGSNISILLKTEIAGSYKLKITAKVGKETIIQKAHVYVS